jgi:hypothetical protein
MYGKYGRHCAFVVYRLESLASVFSKERNFLFVIKYSPRSGNNPVLFLGQQNAHSVKSTINFPLLSRFTTRAVLLLPFQEGCLSKGINLP